MLGRLDKTALASAAIGNTLYYLAWLIGCGPAAADFGWIARATIRPHACSLWSP